MAAKSLKILCFIVVLSQAASHPFFDDSSEGHGREDSEEVYKLVASPDHIVEASDEAIGSGASDDEDAEKDSGEKIISVEHVGSADKEVSAENVVSEEKAVSEAKDLPIVGSAEKAESEEKVMSSEQVVSTDLVASEEKVSSAENVVSEEKVVSAEVPPRVSSEQVNSPNQPEVDDYTMEIETAMTPKPDVSLEDQKLSDHPQKIHSSEEEVPSDNVMDVTKEETDQPVEVESLEVAVVTSQPEEEETPIGVDEEFVSKEIKLISPKHPTSEENVSSTNEVANAQGDEENELEPVTGKSRVHIPKNREEKVRSSPDSTCLLREDDHFGGKRSVPKDPVPKIVARVLDADIREFKARQWHPEQIVCITTQKKRRGPSRWWVQVNYPSDICFYEFIEANDGEHASVPVCLTKERLS